MNKSALIQPKASTPKSGLPAWISPLPSSVKETAVVTTTHITPPCVRSADEDDIQGRLFLGLLDLWLAEIGVQPPSQAEPHEVCYLIGFDAEIPYGAGLMHEEAECMDELRNATVVFRHAFRLFFLD